MKKKKKSVSKLLRGFKEVAFGIIGGIILSLVLSAFEKNGLIPPWVVWIFTLIGILGNISTIKSYRTSGYIFTMGWIAGAWILRDALDTLSFLIYFVVPIIVMITRVYFGVKKSVRRLGFR
jgi:hypothetical protein